MVATRGSAREGGRGSSQPEKEAAIYPMELDHEVAQEGEGDALELDEKEDEEDCAPVRLAPDPGAESFGRAGDDALEFLKVLETLAHKRGLGHWLRKWHLVLSCGIARSMARSIGDAVNGVGVVSTAP